MLVTRQPRVVPLLAAGALACLAAAACQTGARPEPLGTEAGASSATPIGTAPDAVIIVPPTGPINADGLACTIWGTDEGDRLEGTAENDIVCGLGGDDVLIGGGGDDVLDGGDGLDVVSYALAGGPVNVNLAAGSAFGGEGSDLLILIEGAFDSAHDDVLLGTAADDYFLLAEGGADYVDGGEGTDTVDYRSASAEEPEDDELIRAETILAPED